jgi:predicted helicase
MTTPSDAFEFERRVAAIYRALGANVQHDVALAGNQIDVLVEEQTTAGTPIRSAVECKLHLRPIGINTINAFAGLIVLLKSRNLIERGIIVSNSGFTKTARSAAAEHGVDLVEFADLEPRVAGREMEISEIQSQLGLSDNVIVERLP